MNGFLLWKIITSCANINAIPDFSTILLVANILSTGISLIWSEFPVPPLIGLILLFMALVSGLVKLEQVEPINQFNWFNGLLFVPSGTLASSLDLFKQEGIKILWLLLSQLLSCCQLLHSQPVAKLVINYTINHRWRGVRICYLF